MILNIAHRGARSLAPENTLAAGRKALQVGADMWELDVAVTADEHLIVFHDDSLERTTNARDVFPDRAPWTFTKFTLAELQALDCGSWYVDTDPFGEVARGSLTPGELEAFRNERIPTLRQALQFTRDNNWRVNVEIKALPAPFVDFSVVQAVADLIEQLDMLDRIIVSSFLPERLIEMSHRLPAVKFHSLLGQYGDKKIDIPADSSFDGFHPRYNLISDSQIIAAQRAGYGVIPFVVNETADLERMVALGVMGIITDYPQHLERLLHESSVSAHKTL